MEALNLTAEQKAKAAPIFEKARADTRAVKDDGTLTPEQKKEKIRAIRQSTNQQLQPILTPEQNQQLQDMAAKHKEKRSKGDKGTTPATT